MPTENEDLPKSNIVDDLFTTERWGLSPVRQDTPWELPPSPTNNSSAPTIAAAAPNRAPGPTSSMIDNTMTNKTFGMTNRSSTWSAFGNTSTAPNDSDSEWPKSSVISTGNAPQPPPPTNNFNDLVQDPWPGSMLMKGLEDDGLAAFAQFYANSSKSPTGSQYEGPSGIGTWSPVVKSGRPGSKWDGDGPDNGRGDSGRFDDGTAIWGAPSSNKVDWVEKTGDPNNSNNDKSRQTMAGSNQAYRPQQSSSSTSLLMSSNTSPSSQHNRNQQTLKQHSSHSFEQQSNALSSQAIQPNRGLGLSSNVPSSTQLKHMVQQIHLAVQAGHLNAQILNQPLAPTTLQLLYQLLQHIKILHQLQTSPQFNKSGNHPAAVNVNITKTKQNILNLQNQIAATQAVFLKQNNQAQNISSFSSRQSTIPNLATGGLLDGGIAPALPPGISQSGDSFRPTGVINDFHGQSAMANNYGAVDGSSMSANGLANSLGQMNLGVHSANRFDQAWRAPTAKQQQSKMVSPSPFGNPNNLMSGAMASKMMGGNGNGAPSASSYVGMPPQHGGGSNIVGGSDFTRAPGPTSSNMTANKPFGMTNRSSTWSAFGPSSTSAVAPNDSDSEWPKSSGGSTATSMGAGSNATQQSNAFDLVPEFEPGKPWRGSMLMKSVEDDPTMTPASMARSLAPQRKTIWSDEIL